MRRTLFRRTPPFVVDLSRGDMLVSEKLLDLDDVDTSVKEKRGGGGPE